jgi:hypothetical protein
MFRRTHKAMVKISNAENHAAVRCYLASFGEGG